MPAPSLPAPRLAVLFAAAALVAACGAPEIPGADGRSTLPGGEAGRKYQCRAVTGASEPWLVEWDPAAKVRLQSQSQIGVLLVKYEGCSLEVLYGCEVRGGYGFRATTRARNTEYIRSEDELFAKLPIGALNLAGEYSEGDKWSLDYVLVGTRDAEVREVRREELDGRCADATHFVQGMVVGAYRLGSAASRLGGAEVRLYAAGVGAHSGGESGLLRQDGQYEKCVSAEVAATDPDCQAIVQLYLQPVAGTEPDAAKTRETPQGPQTPPPAGDLVTSILALGEGGSDAWDRAVAARMIAAFDENGSSSIDAEAEVRAIPCDVLQALDYTVNQGRGAPSRLKTTYGFSGGFWVGYALGFDQSVRELADARIGECVPDVAPASPRRDIFARIRGVPDGGSDSWDAVVKALLLEAFDRDASGQLDKVNEVLAVPCEALAAMNGAIQTGRGTTSTLRSTYGFQKELIWVGYALGYDERMRTAADAHLAECGL